MNLIMGRRQNKRQEPQAVPLHQQQQQQQQQQHQQQQPQTPYNKQTPPPPPPPPPPPCADDSWELQYCKWWGWNWVKKEHSEMNKYVSLPCEGPTRDNFPPMRCPVMPMKRVDKNTNRFKDFCNCLFSPNRRTAESLQRLYSTPSNSLIYESLCCGNQERTLDSYTCMELRNETRNKSNKNTPNKRSQEKICKCAQEQEKKEKEKRKKYCTCKESSTSLSNCCNCKEKEQPPKKGCNCKESKANAKKACNCKDSSSNVKKCCNCKDSNSNMKKCCTCKESSSNLQKKCCNCKDSTCNLKMCCNCKETTCPKKCCCGCMEPSNVTKKCCGCREQNPPNPPNVTNCCSCQKKSQGVTNTFDCPCQTKPETKCSPCQTIKTNMCECLNIPEKCTCCCHCNCYDIKPPNQPRCRRDEADEMEDEEFTCAICKAREDDSGYLGYSSSVVYEKPKKTGKSDSSVLRRNISQESARRNTMFSYYLPKYNQILTKNQEIMVKKGIQTPWNYPELLLTPENLIGKSEMYEKQTNFAYTRENYWPQSLVDAQRPCAPGCPCRWCKSPPVQCSDCPWSKEYPIKNTSAQTAPYPTIPYYYDPYTNKPSCPYCSVHSMCNRNPGPVPDEDRKQFPKTSKPKRVSKEYDDDDVFAEDPLTTWRKSPEIQKTFKPKLQSPPPERRSVVSDTSARRRSRESSTSSRLKKDSTKYSDLTNPSSNLEEPTLDSRVPSSLSTASTIDAFADTKRFKSTMRPVYPMQLDAAPTSVSLFHLFDAYRKHLRKPKKLHKLQKPLAKIPEMKNWPGNKQSKLYSSNKPNSLDLPIDYSNYINDIEAKITKKLKSRLLLDVLYGVLDSTKNDIESSDEQSSSSESNESDDDDAILPPDEKKRYFKAIKKLLSKSHMSDRKVSTRTRQKRKGSPVKAHPVKKFKHSDTNTDSSEESSGDNFNNLFEKIDKITKESRSNVAKLQDAINSLPHTKEEAHQSRKNQPINPELIDKLYDIINTVADEDAIQNIFDVVSNKKAERERARSKRTFGSGNLFENNDLSENWSTLSSRSLASNDKDVYSNPKPTVSYLVDKDSAKSSEVKSKSKIPIRKAKLKLK